MDHQNQVLRGFPNFNRLYEAHLVAKLPIVVAADLDEYPAAQADFDYLFRPYFVEGRLLPFTSDPAMAGFRYELTKPDFPDFFNNRRQETFDDLIERADWALEQGTPGIDINLDLGASSVELLRNAYDKMNLGVRQVHIAMKVASAIARLDDARKIEVHHIAEAAQYQFLNVNPLTILS